MPGIGKYTKGKKFQLKSGNTPSFKDIGSSPANMNNFGLSAGDSPYRTKFAPDEQDNTNSKVKEKSKDVTVDPVKGGESGWKKALKIGVAGLTGGLDAVYGTGKVVPMISHSKKKKEVESNPVSEEIQKDIEDATGLDNKKSNGNMPDADWEKGQKKAEEMGYNMDDLLSKQKTLEKGSDEWKTNQNVINEALGDEKRH
jgi:hypothetical protein